MKLALDVDSVLADVMVIWNIIYNKEYNKKLKKEDINAWDFWKKLNLSRKEFNDIFTKTWNQWNTIPPTEENLGSKVKELSNLGTVDIVTGRSKETISQVKEWLKKENIVYNKFIRVSPYALKGNLPYDVFIDDSPYNIIDAAKRNKFSLIYDQPWNQGININQNIFRVNDITEAIQIIKDLKKNSVIKL